VAQIEHAIDLGQKPAQSLRQFGAADSLSAARPVRAAPTIHASLSPANDSDIDSLPLLEGNRMTTQLLVRLPDDLARRFKRSVAPRQRSRFIEKLLEDALPAADLDDGDPLYQAALAVEQDQQLADEMAEWEAATIADGMADQPEKSKS
jgi:hypothetical protein